MNMDVAVLKEVVTNMVLTIQKKVKGDMLPFMPKYEALRELGTVHELIIQLHERTEDKETRIELSVIRHQIVKATQNLMGF